MTFDVPRLYKYEENLERGSYTDGAVQIIQNSTKWKMSMS